MSDENVKKESQTPVAEQSQAENPKEAVHEQVKTTEEVVDPEREAKLKRAAEARAARAAAKAAAEGGEAPADAAPAAAAPAAPRRAKAEAAEEAKPKEPSKKQPQLDRTVEIIREAIGAEAVEVAQINDKYDMPTITIRNDQWLKTAGLLKEHPELSMNYLRNLSGVDLESHLEVVYHFINMTTKDSVCVKVKADRTSPSVPSIAPLYASADWNEREVFDLLGIDFPGHPDLRRIMMPDDWVGHPLRKDYEAIDPEV